MDVGKLVSCQRCTTQFYLHIQTHPGKVLENLKYAVGGMCPNCNARVTTTLAIDDPRVETYPEVPDFETFRKTTYLPYHSGE